MTENIKPEELQLQESLGVVRGLADEYTALYYVNLATGEYNIYHIDEKIRDIHPHIANSPRFSDLVQAYAASSLVHPDYREAILAFYPSDEGVRRALAGRKRLSLLFKRNYAGEFLWTRAEIIKCGNAGEEAHNVLVGFRECDDAERTEQTMMASLEILSKENSPDECIGELLGLVGEYYAADRAYIFEFNLNKQIMSNTYEWCAKGIKPMQELLQDVSAKDVEGWISEFKRQGAFYMDSLDDEQNTEEGTRILAMQGIRSLLAAPIMDKTEIIGFIGVDNPAKAGRNVGVMSKLSAVAYSEMLKRDEFAGRNAFTSSFLEPLISAYYIGLDDMSCEVYKRTGDLQERYPNISDYLKNVTEYINTDVYPADREKLLQALHPENIRKRLAKESQFSVIFRDMSGGVEKIFRCQLSRGTDERHAALGFIDVTKETQEDKRLRKIADEQKELLKKAEESQQLVDNFIETFDSVYIVNIPDGSIDRCVMSPEVSKIMRFASGFAEMKEAFISQICHPLDKKRMETELSFATIHAKLSVEPSYSVEFCTLSNGMTMWKEMRVTSLGENKIILGIVEDDVEIAKRHLEEKRYSEYFAIFAVDLDTQMVRIIKNEGGFRTFPVGKAFPYTTVLKAFADYIDDEEPRDFFLQLSDIELVKKKFADEDKHTYSYRSPILGERQWVDVTSFVLRRNPDCSPALFTIGFSHVDSLGAERQELHEEVQKALAIATEEKRRNDALHEIIHSGKWSFTVDENDELVLAERPEDLQRVINIDLASSPWAWTEILHPDDKEAAVAAFKKAIADHSGRTPYDVTYRMINRNGEYRWFRSAGRIVPKADGNREFYGIHIDITDEIEGKLKK